MTFADTKGSAVTPSIGFVAYKKIGSDQAIVYQRNVEDVAILIREITMRGLDREYPQRRNPNYWLTQMPCGQDISGGCQGACPPHRTCHGCVFGGDTNALLLRLKSNIPWVHASSGRPRHLVDLVG